MRNLRPTSQLAHAEATTLAARSLRATDPIEMATRPTGKLTAQRLLDLIDQSAPDDGVVDMHSMELGRATATNKHVARTGPSERATAKFAMIALDAKPE